MDSVALFNFTIYWSPNSLPAAMTWIVPSARWKNACPAGSVAARDHDLPPPLHLAVRNGEVELPVWSVDSDDVSLLDRAIVPPSSGLR